MTRQAHFGQTSRVVHRHKTNKCTILAPPIIKKTNRGESHIPIVAKESNLNSELHKDTRIMNLFDSRKTQRHLWPPHISHHPTGSQPDMLDQFIHSWQQLRGKGKSMTSNNGMIFWKFEITGIQPTFKYWTEVNSGSRRSLKTADTFETAASLHWWFSVCVCV